MIRKNCHKYHLANWPSVSMRKEQGGMGIPDLRDLNLCLLHGFRDIVMHMVKCEGK
jgi:hypothetical protein